MILLKLLFLASVQTPVDVPAHPCTLSMENLSTKARIEMGIGCSYKRGKEVYKKDQLEKIYNEGINQ